MKKLILLVSAIVLFSCSTPTKKYTYIIKYFPDESSSVENYNELGLDGWKLVNARRASKGDNLTGEMGYECIFIKEN